MSSVGEVQIATPRVLSLNVGVPRPISVKTGISGIDKKPTDREIAVNRPTAGGSGLAGDSICDTANHGGVDQAVYAYAREDLDAWSTELGRGLGPGMFGENLTTIGIDITNARIGERWKIGTDCVLQVTCPRIPCRTFAVWLDEIGWVKRFTAGAVPGAYLRVIVSGAISAGDPIVVERTLDHNVTIGMCFRAITSEPHLLPDLLTCPDLTDGLKQHALRGQLLALDGEHDGSPS